MAGVTINGFVPKRFDEIIASLRDNAKPIFQDLVKPGEEVDVGDTSTIGRLIGLIAPDMDELWQAAQQVWQAFDPNSASGIALENVVQYMGITRQEGRPTVLRASVWGSLGLVLPAGQTIRGAAGDDFQSTTEMVFTENDTLGVSIIPSAVTASTVYSFSLVIDEGVYNISYTSTASPTLSAILLGLKAQFDALSLTRYTSKIEGNKLIIESLDYYTSLAVSGLGNLVVVDVKKRLSFNSVANGDISAPVGTVTNIVTPVYGWLSVRNDIMAEKGSVYENDEALRARFRVSKAVRAGNMADALYSQLLELDDVEFVRIYENVTDAIDTKGLPPHSFMTIVGGGTSVNIGQLIWNNKPAGIATHGNTSVEVRDSQNLERTINFSRPVDVPIYISVTVQKTSAGFPLDGAEKIRDALMGYINSQAIIGEDVVYTRLFTPINTVPNHQVNTLNIGKTPSPTGTTNIAIDWDEIPVIQPENISVTVI